MADRYYTPARLSERRTITPEGFLICHDVAIARVGDMLYRAGEISVDAGTDGVIRVSRDAATLFHPDTIASFNGKPVTNDHPQDVVTPKNWKQYVVGTIMEPRRGAGAYRDFLVADLQISDEDTIRDVTAGKREVSCGYDADYETVAPGRGIQRNILGNHVAVVDRGRCGTRCAIGDQDMSLTKDNATVIETTPGANIFAVLARAFGAKDATEASKMFTDAAAAEQAAAADLARKATTDKQTADIAALTATVAAMAEQVKALASGQTTTDTNTVDEGPDADASDELAFKDAAPRFEFLSPGFKVPTFDAKGKRKALQDTLTACKCRALSEAVKTEDGKRAVAAFTDAAGDFTKLDPAVLDTAFIGASEVVRALNNAGLTRDSARPAITAGKGPPAPAELNKSAKDFWADTATKAF